MRRIILRDLTRFDSRHLKTSRRHEEAIFSMIRLDE